MELSVEYPYGGCEYEKTHASRKSKRCVPIDALAVAPEDLKREMFDALFCTPHTPTALLEPLKLTLDHSTLLRDMVSVR